MTLKFACSMDKLAPFATIAAVLGVEVGCSRAHEGKVLVRNKEVAPPKLWRSCGTWLRSAPSRVASLQELWAVSSTRIRTWMRQSKGDFFLPPESVKTYEFLIRRFEVSVPRVVPCVAYIFTDGASEMSGHTVGGVLYLEGRKPRFFSCRVPGPLVRDWSELDHLIGPVEAYVVALARSVWHQFLASLRCLYFIDNFAVLDAFIKGSSPSVHFRQALAAFEDRECHAPTWSVFTRVPSESNCADAPSRGEIVGLLGDDATPPKVDRVLFSLQSVLFCFQNKTGKLWDACQWRLCMWSCFLIQSPFRLM